MPTYEYRCSENEAHKYTEIRSINAELSRSTCAEEGCEGRLIRIYNAPPINFKGAGFSTSKNWR